MLRILLPLLLLLQKPRRGSLHGFLSRPIRQQVHVVVFNLSVAGKIIA